MEPKYLAFRFEVLGNPWVVRYCGERYFNKKYPDHGLDTYAVTECDDRIIFLRTKKLSKETIRHELAHSYIWELGAAVAGLSPDQMEEIYAEMVAKYGKALWKQADKIADAYEILKQRVEETAE